MIGGSKAFRLSLSGLLHGLLLLFSLSVSLSGFLALLVCLKSAAAAAVVALLIAVVKMHQEVGRYMLYY